MYRILLWFWCELSSTCPQTTYSVLFKWLFHIFKRMILVGTIWDTVFYYMLNIPFMLNYSKIITSSFASISSYTIFLIQSILYCLILLLQAIPKIIKMLRLDHSTIILWYYSWHQWQTSLYFMPLTDIYTE